MKARNGRHDSLFVTGIRKLKQIMKRNKPEKLREKFQMMMIRIVIALSMVC